MEVDHDLPGQGTPTGTPFDDGFTPSTSHGYAATIPTGSVRTDNYFTPLNTETQGTDPPNDTDNQQAPTHGDTRAADLAPAEMTATNTIDDAEADAAAAAGVAFVARLAAEKEAVEAAAAAASEAAALAAA